VLRSSEREGRSAELAVHPHQRAGGCIDKWRAVLSTHIYTYKPRCPSSHLLLLLRSGASPMCMSIAFLISAVIASVICLASYSHPTRILAHRFGSAGLRLSALRLQTQIRLAQ